FFQAEDGIRDRNVTGVQTCALPISLPVRRTTLGRHPSTFGKSTGPCTQGYGSLPRREICPAQQACRGSSSAPSCQSGSGPNRYYVASASRDGGESTRRKALQRCAPPGALRSFRLSRCSKEFARCDCCAGAVGQGCAG